MNFRFAKMHGAGNDFLALLDPEARFPLDDAGLVRRMNAPHVGLASEGMLVLRKADAPAGADFRMVFFNPDGSRASMCGNGARCAALCALRAGLAGRRMRFATDAGPVEAAVAEGDAPAGGTVTVRTTDVEGLREPGPLAAEGADAAHPRPADFPETGPFFVDTGVPHAVLFVPDAAAAPVAAWGAFVRWHAAFAPAGTNADFAQVLDRHRIALRTYERGVEDETPACGTGVLAAACVAAMTGRCEFPVTVRVAFGADLRVDCDECRPEGVARGLRLTGPARFVCRGEIDTDDFAE